MKLIVRKKKSTQSSNSVLSGSSHGCLLLARLVELRKRLLSRFVLRAKSANMWNSRTWTLGALHGRDQIYPRSFRVCMELMVTVHELWRMFYCCGTHGHSYMTQ